MRNLAIIPARSGSKGVVDKNIRMLCGKPLMAYSIEAALESGIFDMVHVSTDSEEYADIAREYGAFVPFLRDETLSEDNTSTVDMVRGTIRKFQEIGEQFDNVMVLQPTSPLRDGIEIQKAYELFLQKKAKAVISVCECEHSPLWSNILPENLSMDGFVHDILPRQELPKYFRLNGAIYLYRIPWILETENLYSKGTYAYIMAAEKSVDIDCEMDFNMTEMYINNMNQK